jgi:hypothetical protein
MNGDNGQDALTKRRSHLAERVPTMRPHEGLGLVVDVFHHRGVRYDAALSRAGAPR